MIPVAKRLPSLVTGIIRTGRVVALRVTQFISVKRKRIVEAAAELTMKKIVTVDFCGTDIRILQTRGRRVKKWASISLGSSRIESELLDSPRTLSQSIKEIMTSSGIKGGKVIASISSLYSVDRIIPVTESQGRLPNQEEILDLVKDEISVATDELYFSWQDIEEGGGTTLVHIMGVPKDVVDTVVKASRAAGVNPYMLDLNTMALSRVVNREKALILSINPTILNIIVSVDGLPVVTRTIPWQQDELDSKEQVEYLSKTVRLVVSYYNEKNPENILDSSTPFFVTGQLSTDLTFTQELQAGLEFPLESLAPQFDYPAHFPVSEYAANLGLALRDSSFSNKTRPSGRSFSEVNLLPRAFKPWRPSARQILYSLGVLVAIGLTYFMYQMTADIMDRTADLDVRYNVLDNQLRARQLAIKGQLPMNQAIRDYNTILAMDGYFTGDLGAVYDEAARLDVQVDSVTHNGKNMIVTCRADTYVLFREYLVALGNVGRFSTPIAPPEGYPFTTYGSIALESLTLVE